jgi:ABC-type polysaccharide/polyol phosphate export permease
VRGYNILGWLQTVYVFNPLTYWVDALRQVTLGQGWEPLFPLYLHLMVIFLFDVAMIVIGTLILNRRK